MNAIMDFIRDSQGDPLTRDHLTICLDLHNIKHQYNISCMQNNANRVLFWVEEMKRENYNPAFCFRRLGEKSTHTGLELNDFILGIQTEFQRDMFVQYANKLVCVDATHATNSFQYFTDFFEMLPKYAQKDGV